MVVRAWCGSCGESFPLAEVVEPPAAGRCPRCGLAFAPSYASVAVSAVRRLLEAVAELEEAGETLRGVAPRLHVDVRALDAEVGEALDG